MKTPQKFNFKYISVLILCFVMSTYAKSQERINGIISPKKATKKIIKIDSSKILTFPLSAKKTTDVNYKSNIKKSKETQANFVRQPIIIVKNNQYYTERILKLKRRIQDIENYTDYSSSSNRNKLEGLKGKLKFIEQEYTRLKKSK